MRLELLQLSEMLGNELVHLNYKKSVESYELGDLPVFEAAVGQVASDDKRYFVLNKLLFCDLYGVGIF